MGAVRWRCQARPHPVGAGLGFGLAAEASCCLLQVFPMSCPSLPPLGQLPSPFLEAAVPALTAPTLPDASLAQAAARGLGNVGEPWRGGSGSADSQQEIHCGAPHLLLVPEFLFGKKGLVLPPSTKKKKKREKKGRERLARVWRAVTRLL